MCCRVWVSASVWIRRCPMFDPLLARVVSVYGIHTIGRNTECETLVLGGSTAHTPSALGITPARHAQVPKCTTLYREQQEGIENVDT